MPDDRKRDSQKPDRRTEEVWLTREYVEHAIYQFPPEQDRVLMLRAKGPRDSGFHRAAGAPLFERHRSRWVRPAPPDMNAIFPPPDRKAENRTLASAVGIAISACVLAWCMRSPASIPDLGVTHESVERAASSVPAIGADRQERTPPSGARPSGTPVFAGAAERPLVIPALATVPIRAFRSETTETASAVPSETPLTTAVPTSLVFEVATAATSLSSPVVLPPSAAVTRIAAPEVVAGSAAAAPGTLNNAITVPTARLDDRDAINGVLLRYRTAFDSLDAGAAQAVWPEVNRRALERGFSQLESQSVAFNDCNVSLQAGRATARCQGHTTYVPKIGNRSERTEARRWTFELQKSDERWTIAAVDTR